ncbi:MAG: RDD family protein [Terriglobales bacterium]
MASSQQLPVEVPQRSFAGLGSRIAAHFLDVLISLSVIFVVGFLLRGLRVSGLWMPATAKAPPEEIWRGLGAVAKLAVVIGYLLSIGPIYLALFEASPWQASFGKRILNIYVTDNEGRRISTARSFGRSVTKWILNSFLLWPFSMVAIATSKKKKALHDFVAETLVVKGRPTPEGALEPWRAVVAFGIPFVWLMGTFLATL